MKCVKCKAFDIPNWMPNARYPHYCRGCAGTAEGHASLARQEASIARDAQKFEEARAETQAQPTRTHQTPQYQTPQYQPPPQQQQNLSDGMFNNPQPQTLSAYVAAMATIVTFVVAGPIIGIIAVGVVIWVFVKFGKSLI